MLCKVDTKVSAAIYRFVSLTTFYFEHSRRLRTLHAWNIAQDYTD